MSKPSPPKEEKQQPTLLEVLKEAASVVLESRFVTEVGREVGGMFDHGRTELAAAMFNGGAFVMYMKGQDEVEQTPLHGMPEKQRESEGRDL